MSYFCSIIGEEAICDVFDQTELSRRSQGVKVMRIIAPFAVAPIYY